MDELDKQFSELLKQSVVSHYGRLTDKYDDIYGYAIATTDLIEGLFPVANLRSTIECDESADDFNYFKYCPAEWHALADEQYFESDEIDLVVSQFEELADSESDDGGTRERFLNLILDVLVALESEGVFGAKTEDRYVTIYIAGSDEEWITKASSKLNSDSVHRNCMAGFAG